jgi:MFS transporter, DHA2 family, methylenomycin A resistance protein
LIARAVVHNERVRPRRRLALVVACLGYFFVLLDVTVVNVALGHIATGLHASRGALQWVVDAYALVLASAMLSAGDIADLFGQRRVFAAGLAVFAAASAACAAAPGVGVLIAARAAQGLGAAAILPTSLAIVNRTAGGEERRSHAIGVWAAVGSAALVAGPICGGALVSALGWRSVFWLNVPLCLLGTGLAASVLPPLPGSAGAKLDVRGQLLATAWLALLVASLIEAGRMGLGSAPVVAGLVLFALTLALFVRVERRRPRPMLALEYFRRPSFTAANAGAGLMNLSTLGALFAVSLFFQRVQHHSPFATGVRLIPWMAPLMLLSPLVGRLTGRIGPRAPAAAGLILAGLGYLALAGLSPGTPYLEALPGLLLAGIGLAAATPALVAGATAAVESERAGMAAAVNNTSRQTGGAIGVALIGSLAGVGSAVLVSGCASILGGVVALGFLPSRS